MDPYVYRGTSVLKNLRDIRDHTELSRVEALATSRRIAELAIGPKPRATFDRRHIQSVHRYIFQDLFGWAGEFRTVDIARPGQFYFALSQHIVPALDAVFDGLRREQYLAKADPEGFCSRAAHYMGELNAIHPFRDGNGRTQREFIRQLALRNGYSLNWCNVTRAEMNEASAASFQRGDNTGLTAVLRCATGGE